MSGAPDTGGTAAASGILIVDKPAGWTSHQVVGRVRRLLGTRRVGHAGTLDPMATGVLIIGVNRATRLLGHLALHDKSYLATIRLGESTTTDDADGELVESRPAGHLTADDVEAVVTPYRGDILQVPSSVSAIKVDGRRAYARVRAGEQVQLSARPVHVSRFDLVAVRHDPARPGVLDVDVVVDCSSGTYVRALARDLGSDLGVGGHLTSLRRTRIGRYDLTSAVDVTRDEPPALTPMAEAAALSFPTVAVDAAEAVTIGHGGALARILPGDPTAMIGPDGDLLALYRPAADGCRPVAVLV